MRDPEPTVRKMCSFCSLPFDAAYLDVPHVNKSDTPYNKRSERRGLSASRVFYYRDALSPVEQAAVRLAIDDAALNRLYPELAEPVSEATAKERFQAAALLASSAALLIAEEFGLFS